MGRSADPDPLDRGRGCGSPHHHQPRNDEGSVKARMGVGIEVRGLNAWYGKNQSLNSIDMTVLANHVTAAIGPLGFGKSPFLRCLKPMPETIPEARAEGSVQ